MQIRIQSFILLGLPVLAYLRMALHALVVLLDEIVVIPFKLTHDIPVQQGYIFFNFAVYL